jgi:mxaJ protein
MRAVVICAALVVLAPNTSPPLAGRSAPRADAALRVCADPNNLPFSNQREEGFENHLAQMLAREIGAHVEYTWRAQRRGFLRETLGAGACDVVMGQAAGAGPAQTTTPYYRSTYVFVTRASRHLAVQSFDDAALRRLRIGVQVIGDDGVNSPPAHALSRRGLVANLVGYSVYGDYGTDSPPSRIVEAVARGDVDVAAVWGPLAGFFAARQRERLHLTAVSPQTEGGLAEAFDIAMAVRRGDTRRLARLEQFIRARRSDIDSLLARYHVPRIDGAGAVRW